MAYNQQVMSDTVGHIRVNIYLCVYFANVGVSMNTCWMMKIPHHVVPAMCTCCDVQAMSVTLMDMI